MDSEGRWIDQLFAAIDGRDHLAFAGFFAADASFRFGNSAPVRGRQAIAESVAGFFSALRGLQHRIDERWLVPDTAIVSGTVRYTRHDGSSLQVPFANILKLRQGAIQDYLIFVDSSALFAPQAGAVAAVAESSEQ